MAGGPSGKFSIHKQRPSGVKRAGSWGGLAVLVLVVGSIVFAFSVGEPTIVEHVKKHDALATGGAYVLGFRGVKSEATRTALMEVLNATTGDKAAPPDLRAAAAFALGSSFTRDSIVTLADSALHDPDADVRAAAVKSVGKSGDTLHGYDSIRACIDDPVKKVQLAGVEAAGYLKDMRFIDTLIQKTYEQNDYDLRKVAAKSLEAITGEHFGISGQEWFKWREAHK